jgi:hypothetical protein
VLVVVVVVFVVVDVLANYYCIQQPWTIKKLAGACSLY